MIHKLLLLAIATAFIATGNATAQKKIPTKPVGKPTAAANNDSLEVRTLVAAAKQGNSEAQNTLGTYFYLGKKVKQNYEVALKWFSLAAKQKHVKAIANMGLCYQKGRGITPDSLMAVKLYKESIKAGNAQLVKQREENVEKNKSAFDINLLADLYYHGCGTTVKKDTQQALKYYKMAAESGSAEATIKVAAIYNQDKMYAEALPYLKQAADQGNASAAYKYGEYLCNGKGTVVDKTTAATYLERAAKHNILNAMMLLADLLYKADGVPQDYARAMLLYKQAAAKGNTAAMWNIGIMYKNGLSVKPNYIIALQWFAYAAEKGMLPNFQKQLNEPNVEIKNGWKNTDFARFVHALALFQAQTPPNYMAITKELTVLEKKNIAAATTLLGLCHADSTWKKATPKKMLEYYEKAAQAADPYAYYLLAQLHHNGSNVVTTDKNKVVEYYEKAAKADFAPALCELGNLYFNGKIVNKNITKAIAFYNEALLNGYLTKEAANNLAACYQQGLGGLKKDQTMVNEIVKRGQDTQAYTQLLKNITFE